MKKKAKQEETPSVDKTVEQEPVIGITITAAKLICEVITICTKRGAFQPNELTVVGTLFNQLSAQIPAEEVASDETEKTEESEEETQLELELEDATK